MRPPTPKRLLLILSPLVLYPYATPAPGGEVQISFSYDDHRRCLDDCETKLSQICAEVASARASLDQAFANQSAAASSLAAANGQIQTSARCIADAQGRIDLIDQSLIILRDRATAARAGFEAAKAKADTTTAEVINYQNAARATFESSPAYSHIATDLASAKAAYNGQVQGTLDALRSTNDYAELYDRMEDLEEAVQFERNRNPIDQASLSAASVDWMNAKNALERFKADQINADPLAREAQARINAIEQARQELVTRFSNDLAADPNLKSRIAAASAAQQDAQFQAAAANNTAADVTAREQAIANLQATITSESARLAQSQSDAAAWQSAFNQYAADAANADAWLRTLWVREASCRRERDCAAENLRICLAERDYRPRDNDRDRGRDDWHRQDVRRDHDYRRPDVARDGYGRDRDGKFRDPRDRDEKDRQQREDAIASVERTDREGLAARYLRDRADEQRLALLPSADRQKAEQQLTEERRRRELDRQQVQSASIGSDSPTPRVATAVSAIGPVNNKSPIVLHPLSPAEARNAAQREQIKNAEARDRSPQSASAPPPTAAKARATEENENRPSPSKNDRKPRETETRDDSSRQPKESSAKADHDRQQRDAQARAEQEHQQKESQSHAERDRQDREARARAEDDHRRQRESQSKSEDDRRQSESQSKSEGNRHQRDAQAKSDQDRQQREAQNKSEQDRKSADQQRQSDRRAEDSDRGRDTPRSSRTR